MVEAMEPRQLLSATPADIVQNPFPSTAASISGQVFLDNNQNGLFDTGDVPLAAQTVFVDVNVDGVADAGDEIASTDTSGNYLLLVPAGIFTIDCVPSPGLQFSALLAPPITIDFLAGDALNGLDFAEIGSGTIDATVFGDTNANGIQDPGEIGLDNRTVYLDNNNDSVFDAGDLLATSFGSGSYEFNGLPPATYLVRVQPAVGSTITTPVGGSASIVVGTGGQVSTTFGLNGADLSIALLTAPPAALVGGEKQKPLQVSVTNAGTSLINGAVGVNIYASTDNVFSPTGDTIVSVLLGKNMKLKPGQSKKLKVQLTVPATLPSGSYFLIAQVISSQSDENAANDAAVPAAATAITQPLIDLSISYGAQPIYIFDRATPGSISLVITNNGNIDFNGNISLSVYASTDGTVQNGTLLAQTRPKHFKILAGTGKATGLTVPANRQTTGTFFIVSVLSPSSVIGDNNQANNTVVSTLPTQIF
jgi:hypothetical protein